MDPVLTNLVYPLSLVALGAWIKRQFDKRDRKDDRIAALLEQREAKKEEAITEWRQRFQSTLCDVKVKVEEISEEMHNRVPFVVCDGKEREMKRTIEDHDRRIRAVGG
jgi:hypothetical protein